MNISEKIKKLDSESPDGLLAGEVARLMGAAIRTISHYCEQRLIIAPTTGRGDRRRFTAEQLVEVGIIQRLSEAGLSIARVRLIMDFLRDRDYGGVCGLLKKKELHLVVPTMKTNEVNFKIIFNRSDAPDSEKIRLLDDLFSIDADGFFVFDIRAIATEVLARL